MGRGPQLVEADLLHALGSGQLAHAVLDVTEPEPLPEGHVLWSMPNVSITPHIAGLTRPLDAAECIAREYENVRSGRPLQSAVNRTPS